MLSKSAHCTNWSEPQFVVRIASESLDWQKLPVCRWTIILRTGINRASSQDRSCDIRWHESESELFSWRLLWGEQHGKCICLQASDAGDFASAFSCLKNQQRVGEIPGSDAENTAQITPSMKQTTVPTTPRDQDNKTEQRHFWSLNFLGFGASQQFLFQHTIKWKKCVPVSLINAFTFNAN